MHFVVMSFCMRLHYSYKLESTKFKNVHLPRQYTSSPVMS